MEPRVIVGLALVVIGYLYGVYVVKKIFAAARKNRTTIMRLYSYIAYWVSLASIALGGILLGKSLGHSYSYMVALVPLLLLVCFTILMLSIEYIAYRVRSKKASMSFTLDSLRTGYKDAFEELARACREPNMQLSPELKVLLRRWHSGELQKLDEKQRKLICDVTVVYPDHVKLLTMRQIFGLPEST